jgi:uroporphyrinogen III methyltransferase/synthase
MTAAKTRLKKKANKVYLVGAGPGDPGLITVRGAQLLARADVVIYDYLSDPALLAYAPEKSEKIYVGKSGSRHTMEQDEINALIVKKGLQGKNVVRLKGGDPFVFGRGGEECEALRSANIPYEVVPGITSGIAAPAYAGIPVTHRKMASSVAFITGNEDPKKASTAIRWEHLAKAVDTLVFYMGVGNLPAITNELIKQGKSPATPVAVIRWGTKPSQQTVTGTLETIADIVNKAGIRPPAITVVGEVVSLRENLEWFEHKPLFGKRIINTRTREQASELSVLLAELGAEVVEMPTIEIEKISNKGGSLDRAIGKIDKYDWLIFTSPNGVDAFFDALLDKKRDIRALGKVRIASIGPGTTAAIRKYRVHVDCTATVAIAEGLVKSLRGFAPWNGRKVLLPRAEKARDVLPGALAGWGANVTVIPVYRTVRPRKEDASASVVDYVINGQYDLITFSSSSTFENFMKFFDKKEYARLAAVGLKAASIGPVTSTAIKAGGNAPLIEAREHTIPGLVNAIKEYFQV